MDTSFGAHIPDWHLMAAPETGADYWWRGACGARVEHGIGMTLESTKVTCIECLAILRARKPAGPIERIDLVKLQADVTRFREKHDDDTTPEVVVARHLLPKPRTLDDLVTALRALGNTSKEMKHVAADALLINFVGDKRVAEFFAEENFWYS